MKLSHLQSAVLRGAENSGDSVVAAASSPSLGNLVITDFANILTVGWEGVFLGVRNPCEVLTSLGFVLSQSRG